MTVISFPRRLSDDLRLAFHAACDEGDLRIAERLLRVLRKHRAASHIFRQVDLTLLVERLAELQRQTAAVEECA